MNRWGLSEHEIGLIRGVLKRFPAITEAILFGSRAKGTARRSSDVDLALRGIDNPLLAEEIASELEELPLPYRFDVLALSTIASDELREHIARIGVNIL